MNPGTFVVDLKSDSLGIVVSVRHIAAEEPREAEEFALQLVAHAPDWRSIGIDRCEPAA